VILVPQDVADSSYAAPFDLGSRLLEVGGQSARCLGDDFDRALYDEAQFPISFEIRECLAGSLELDALDRLQMS
jgi:hypothetical protein